MKHSTYVLLKFVGLFVGFTAKFATGSIFVFNVYQDAIKETFNYTQKEVELLSSMLNVGLGVGFVPGMFYDRFGPTLTSGMGLVISVPVFVLIWSTTKHVTFYSRNAWLMAIYFFLCGFGSVFTYMVALNTNVINFHKKHTGKIVGFLNAFFAGSPSVFATVYYNLFTTGDTTVVANQNFGGFMIFFAVLYAVANLLCMAFLRVYTDPNDNVDPVSVKYYQHENGITIQSENDITKTTGDDIQIDTDNKEISLSLKKLLTNVDFHLFAWMFALSSCVSLVFGNNITVTSRSLGFNQYNDKLVIIIPITNAVISATTGITSDYFKARIPRLSIVVGACVLFVISQTLVVIFADKFALFIIATVLIGMGVGIIWSLCPTIMKELFSVENLGRNWGIALLLAALTAFASQAVFGALYDKQVTDEDSVYCYGRNCIQAGYVVFLAVAVFSALLGLIILLRKRCCKRT